LRELANDGIITLGMISIIVVVDGFIMNVRKLPVAAKELGIPYYRLISLLRAEKVAPPQKDPSGDYIWTDADLEAARRAMGVDYRRKRVDSPSS
jgi:hypothetical protein